MIVYLRNALMGIFSYTWSAAYESSVIMLLVCCIAAIVILVYFHAAVTITKDVVKAMTLCYPEPERVASPFNISRLSVYERNTLRDVLHWNNYALLPNAVLLQNNGKTVVMRIASQPRCTPYINGACFDGYYYFEEAIFKWGLERSEHSMLNGTTSTTSQQLEQIVEALDYIQIPGSCVELPPFPISTLFHPINDEFYKYSGTYSNGINELPTDWIIFPRVSFLSLEQLQQFTLLRAMDGSRMLRNVRHEQRNSPVHFLSTVL